MIASILLIPAEQYREALLGESFLNCRPPTMHQWRDGERGWIQGGFPNPVWKSYECALVLAYRGAVVREGRDRAAYVLADKQQVCGGDAGLIFSIADDHDFEPGWVRLTGLDMQASWKIAAVPHNLSPTLARAWSIATLCATESLGRVVLLDTDGREIAALESLEPTPGAAEKEQR